MGDRMSAQDKPAQLPVFFYRGIRHCGDGKAGSDDTHILHQYLCNIIVYIYSHSP